MITLILKSPWAARYEYSGIEPNTKENVRYAHGHLPPNYPVPATLHNADTAINYTAVTFCQCESCVTNFMEGLDSAMWDND